MVRSPCRHLPTTRDIYEPTVYSCGESGRNCQVRLGAPSSPSPLSTPMRRMRSGCCARAASGHAVAAPSSVMNSRRLMSNTGGPPTASRRHQPDCHRHSSGRCDGRHRMVDCAGLGEKTDDEQRLAAIESAALGMEFSFQAEDHNAFAISIVRFLVALPPSGTCYSAPNICSSQPELCGRVGGRCTAAFQSPLCPLWLIHDQSGRIHSSMYVRCCPKDGVIGLPACR